MASTMLEWMKTTLENNPDKYFITQTHVFPGNNWFETLEVLWNKTYTDTFPRSYSGNRYPYSTLYD